MNPARHIFRQLILPVALATCQMAFGEGTRELQPDGASLYTCQLMPAKSGDYGPFAVPGCPANNRLWFTTYEAGEIVYLGFRPGSSGMTYNIRDEAGTALVTGQALPTTAGTGYIETYAQAVAGPNTISAGGYTPFTFSPPAPGNYYIEFDWSGSGTRTLTYFDITVADAGGIEKRGRLWSKRWSLTTGSYANQYIGLMYPYSDDMIVTSIDFNGMAPFSFNVTCNPLGCNNTEPFVLARKSRVGNHTYSQYKIFLNPPDELLFPTGVMGEVTSITTDNECDGNLDFIIHVNKSGTIDIMLDINPLPGFQPEDINLADSVIAGIPNIITWTGLNGLGQPVPNGTEITLIVSYVNGLTNLPMFDVENDKNWGVDFKGIKIELVRPAGVKPKVYWDDSFHASGSVNFDGCLDPAGCHVWDNPVGNNNTINSWWYSLSTTLSPITMMYRRSDSIGQSYQICNGDSILVMGQWIYTPDTLYDSVLNIMGCDSIHFHFISVMETPEVNLGNDTAVCQGESIVLDAGFVSGYTYLWSTGEITPQITVSNTGSYTVTVTHPNNCQAIRQKNVYVSPPPGPVPIKHH